ncbi:PulJ/GspJ family protein [Methylocapsa acidiphila]|uniref:PulJ/GspJ family protein n=1 Tax=Methylocapsa acidiphila TaxID=133552 RepID=UPI0004279F38|nr:prepilin-type N-terminal cleavage/methylation domain-containing protein [Methylocapsa acidiphila]
MRRALSIVRRLLSDAQGFTMIEALVAVALTGLIFAILATVTAQWLPNWKAGFHRTQRVELLGLGLDRIVADLVAAEFVSGEGTRPLFEGGPSSATFVRTALGVSGTPGLEIVRLAEDEESHNLVRARAPFRPIRAGEVSALEFTNPIALVRDAYRLTFSFAGHDRDWRETWRDATLLPEAVRVTVRDRASDEIIAVSTATLLHVNAPAECVRANSALGCIQQLTRPNGPKAP